MVNTARAPRTMKLTFRSLLDGTCPFGTPEAAGAVGAPFTAGAPPEGGFATAASVGVAAGPAEPDPVGAAEPAPADIPGDPEGAAAEPGADAPPGAPATPLLAAGCSPGGNVGSTPRTVEPGCGGRVGPKAAGGADAGASRASWASVLQPVGVITSVRLQMKNPEGGTYGVVVGVGFR